VAFLVQHPSESYKRGLQQLPLQLAGQFLKTANTIHVADNLQQNTNQSSRECQVLLKAPVYTVRKLTCKKEFIKNFGV